MKVYRTTRKSDGYLSYQVPVWEAGQRRMRTFSDADEALKAALEIARNLARGNILANEFTAAEAASLSRAREMLHRAGIADPIELVTARYIEAVKLLGNGKRLAQAAEDFARRNPASLPTKSVAEVVAEMLASKKGHASGRYLDDLKSRLGRFANDFQMPIARVRPGDLQKWLDGLDLSAQTKLNFKRVLTTFFEFALVRGFTFENPAAKLIVPKIKSHPTEIYTPSEMTKLLEVADKDFRPVLVLDGFCGLRSNEIERIAWSEVHLAEGFVEVTAGKAKTGSRRTVPLSTNAIAWLAPYAKATGSVWPGDHYSLYDRQQECAQAAGITWKANALRHSFASYRLAILKNPAEVAMEMGNSASMVHQHYKELVTEIAAKAWFSILPSQASNVVNLPAAVVA